MAKTYTSIFKKEALSWLNILHFNKNEENENVYYKSYCNYSIQIDLKAGSILYTEPITVNNKATSNLYSRENLVVLECIDRLLRKGYLPQYIELEKSWKLGHRGKGRLDILVKEPQKNKPYLMIECKTWGKEYNGGKSKMYNDGGQLISYYIQARTTKYLCLYSSTIADNKINYVNDIINITDDLSGCTDSESLHENGIRIKI
jgi:type I restriction enzyme M protein